jgi:transposase InsO family protein
MMLDRDVVACSPATVYRVLKRAGLLGDCNVVPSRHGTGFVQPLKPHQHWHVDVSYLNIAGTFYYLCSVLDGYSRAVVHWEIRESMAESAVEVILQRARECHPGVTPRVISDNGPQFCHRALQNRPRMGASKPAGIQAYTTPPGDRFDPWTNTTEQREASRGSRGRQ